MSPAGPTPTGAPIIRHMVLAETQGKRYVFQLWGRAVHIRTEVDGKGLVLCFDGEKTMQAWE